MDDPVARRLGGRCFTTARGAITPWVVAFALATVPGCGTSEPEAAGADASLGGGGGASGSGGISGSSGAGGNSGSGAAATDAPSEQPATDAPTEGSTCSNYPNATNAPTLTVTFENQRSTPIYVGTPLAPCSAVTEFFAATSGSAPLKLSYPEACQATCECPGCGVCDAGCSSSTVQRIDPGAKFDVSWKQLALLPRTNPPGCTTPEACLQVSLPPAASYDIRADARTECSGCSCSTDGKCTWGPGTDAGVSGELLSVTQTVALPGAAGVNFVFK